MTEVEKDHVRYVYREGLFARALGRACSSNPHPPNSEESVLWEKGWRLIDKRRENVRPASAAFSSIKLVPDFTPGARATVSRPVLLKPPKSLTFLLARVTNMLRILAVAALIVFMLAALRW